MAWTPPHYFLPGEIATDTIMNATVKANQDVMGAAWTSYTVGFTASAGTPAIGNGTKVGRYMLVDKTCWYAIELTAGSTTTWGTAGAYVYLGLPVVAAGVNGLRQDGLAVWSSSGPTITVGRARIGANSWRFSSAIPSLTTRGDWNLFTSGNAQAVSGCVWTVTGCYEIA